MPLGSVIAYEPRKTPIQARSTVTVEAISEATIQVLLTHGTERLTTTRVAARAGVSVGTLYQYYPNKQSLLLAVLENHLNRVTERVEAACKNARQQPLAKMIEKMVEGFVDAKMERADVSVALYRIATEMGGPALTKSANERSLRTVVAMLETATDIESPPDRFAVNIMLSAMRGAMRSLLETGPTPATIRKAREQLVLLCQSYIQASIAQGD